MVSFNIFKPGTFVRDLSCLVYVVTVVYFICMFVAPWIQGRGDWTYVQNVWDRWQSLNVGLLAFIASITALNISRFNSERQRERDFLASKAFLPSALSELVDYFEVSAVVYKEGWSAAPGGVKPDFKLPKLPNEYKPVFQECIRHAPPDVGNYLSQILMRLQVHDARLRSYVSQGEDDSQFNFMPQQYNLISYFYHLGELQAMVNKLFYFARNIKEFEVDPITWEDFHTAYANLNIWEEQIRISDDFDLEIFTKRAIARSSDQNT